MEICIPSPCHESLENMKPSEKGFHCAQCNKEVIDFRDWEQKKIQAYLLSQTSKKPCGIFLKNQMQKPVVIHINQFAPKTFRQLFLLAFLVCFSYLFSGCDENKQKGQRVTVHFTEKINAILKTAIDSIDLPKENHSVGNFRVPIQEKSHDSIEDISFKLQIENEELYQISTADSSQKNDEMTTPNNLVMGAIISEMPRFKEGNGLGLNKWIEHNFVYPPNRKNVSGKIYCRFTVDTDRTITNVEIMKNTTGYADMDSAVVAMMYKMPKWKPGKEGGKVTAVKFHLPIEFAPK